MVNQDNEKKDRIYTHIQFWLAVINNPNGDDLLWQNFKPNGRPTIFDVRRTPTFTEPLQVGHFEAGIYPVSNLETEKLRIKKIDPWTFCPKLLNIMN